MTQKVCLAGVGMIPFTKPGASGSCVSMSAEAVREALKDAGASYELLTYEALGFCGVGGAKKFVMDGDNTYGGQVVTNPSGGLLSKAHPLGATGLAQRYELTRQLRGAAQATQVDGAQMALQHNPGLGGACVVTLYGRN